MCAKPHFWLKKSHFFAEKVAFVGHKKPQFITNKSECSLHCWLKKSHFFAEEVILIRITKSHFSLKSTSIIS